MIIECRTPLAEALVTQELAREHLREGADFQRQIAPLRESRTIFSITVSLPAHTQDILRHYARNTYGLRIRRSPEGIAAYLLL